jgi:hypothetical protein
MRKLANFLSWAFMICLGLGIRYWRREQKCIFCGQVRHEAHDDPAHRG